MMIDSTQADTPAEGAVAATVSPQKLAILDVAQVLFTEQGYEGLSMRDLAQHCGLAKATIYHHFRDKENCYAAVSGGNWSGCPSRAWAGPPPDGTSPWAPASTP